ncbi:uncharacterized protein LOC130132849 [Lampris incognitus]|uniref:uncharacterized protein LOC130132849 n=1 Tax=Lampris incognitus TaxID=2546036 RepID=UPI0024B6186B|nr:uncharacterized protein LOC130132849 [Lampris incognitus]
MPKYCCVPGCGNDSGSSSRRKSFYKFPLHDPERLQQWLSNIGREDWIPSRHQYICHEHFTSSCFRVRWGIRYLESDAVPTVFRVQEKRKGGDHSERESKHLRGNGNIRTASSAADMPAADMMEIDGCMNTVHLYEITVDPSQPGEALLVGPNNVGGSKGSFQTEPCPLQSVDGPDPPADFPIAFFQRVEGLGSLHGGGNPEVVFVSDRPAGEGQEELVNGITAAILTQGELVMAGDSFSLGGTELATTSQGTEDKAPDMEGPQAVRDDRGAQVIAYFETIPNVLPNVTSAQFAITPDTVLSSALGSQPITSTLPIVSKHVSSPSPASLMLAMESLDTEEGEGDTSATEDSGEQQGHALEEHCYYKSSLSKEQLEAIVAELQKKVKVLQQRHRRHLEKLLGLENTVSQLRQNNLLNEERLQLLERAYVQTSTVVSDAGETVAIIYEEDNGAYLYAPLNDRGEEVEEWTHGSHSIH